MNPQQNQNQPDYGFIVNQQLPSQQPKKKLPKPLLVLGGVLVFGVIFILVFVLLVPQNNVQRADISPDIDGSAVTEAYLVAISQNNLQEAYDLLAAETQEEWHATLFYQLIPGIFSNIDPATCRQDGSIKQTSEYIGVSFICSAEVGDANAELQFEVIAQDGVGRIRKYDIVATNKEPGDG